MCFFNNNKKAHTLKSKSKVHASPKPSPTPSFKEVGMGEERNCHKHLKSIVHTGLLWGLQVTILLQQAITSSKQALFSWLLSCWCWFPALLWKQTQCCSYQQPRSNTPAAEPCTKSGGFTLVSNTSKHWTGCDGLPRGCHGNTEGGRKTRHYSSDDFSVAWKASSSHLQRAPKDCGFALDPPTLI